MTNHNMIYNSQKEELIISEYGRNVQNLIEYGKTIESDEERQQFIESIINLMHQMNPIHRNNAEYKEKLWRHLFRIADYDIKVAPPSGVIPSRESKHFKPTHLEYPENQKRFRHYGSLVKSLIKRCIEMEDPEKQEEFLMVIASYMKLAYRTWNREHYVNDEVIKSDIASMSGGKLKLADDKVIEVSAPVSHKRSRKSSSGSGKGGYRHGKKGGRRRR